MNERQRRLSAIMFTDLVGFTKLAQAKEDRALALLEEHRRLLRPVFAGYGGKEVKTIGDGFLVEFVSALDAVRSAVAMQQVLHDRNLTAAPEDAIHLRIGLHVGDVVHSGDDVYGDAVNVASRIEPLAEPGGVCLSDRVFHDVRNKIDCPMASLGKRELKNVESPVEVYRLLLPWVKDSPQSALLLEKRRIVVLPLVNMGGDPADEYFADGLTEELISAISAIRNLRVISRTSAMKYKETQKGIPEIARELSVGTVVEGSVRKAGDKVRISVQLIDATADVHLWAEQYDRELKDVFAIQADIARHAAESLQVSLLTLESQRSVTRAPVDSEVHALYLKGRFSANKRTEEGLHRGIAYFQQALELDPAYALAYAGLAESYLPLSVYCHLAPKDAMPKAKAAAQKALEIDPALAEARTVLAVVNSFYEWNWRGGLKELRVIVDANPNYPRARQVLSECLTAFGRFTEARTEVKQALDLDPLSLPINTGAAWILYFSRQYDAAIRECNTALEIDSHYFPARMFKGLACAQRGLFSESLNELEEARALSHSNSYVLGALGEAYALAGKRAEAEVVLRELAEMRSRRYVSQVPVAAIFIGLGDPNRAWDCLHQALEDRCPLLRFLAHEPAFDGLRADSRFQEILDRLGLRERSPGLPDGIPGGRADKTVAND
jgi:adenylate cyclase